MIGLVRGQTLQVNLVAIPTDPCFATLGFQDANQRHLINSAPSEPTPIFHIENTFRSLARTRALVAYKDFLTLWKDADPGIPVLKQAIYESRQLSQAHCAHLFLALY